MRIAQIAPPWLAVPPKGYGGIEWVVALLADGLAEGGHEVTLFATGDSTTKANLDFVFETAPGSKLINDPSLDAVHTLHAYRDPERFDLFHVHSPFSAMAAAVLLPRPVVHTLHGAFTPDMRRLYAEVGDRAWFVAISENQRSHMPELNYAGVVYNGVNVPDYPFRDRKDDFVLFLGRAAPDKGALRAALAARESGVRLVMTEAMACGTPVIATPRGSVPEVVMDGETGFIVPVQDYPAQAAGALRRLGEIDPAACRARVQERFSKEAMVAGYEDVFRRVTA